VFGLLTAATGGPDCFQGWPIAAYVLVAAVLFVNASPFVQRMPKVAREALEADAGLGSVDEVARRIASIRTGVLVPVALNAALSCRDHRGHGREALLTTGDRFVVPTPTALRTRTRDSYA
jgi:hypothetical protein